MFCCKQNRKLIVQSVNLLNFCTIPDKTPKLSNDKIMFFTKILELSNRNETINIFEKHKCLVKVEQEDVWNSFRFLTDKIGITVSDIRKTPRILRFNEIILRNRHEILTECGCTDVNAFCFSRYSALTKLSESRIKSSGVIHSDVNVQQRLADILNVELCHPCKEDMSITKIRMQILQLFCSQNNLLTPAQFQHAIEQYPQVRDKSYQSTKEIIEILLDECHTPKETIKDDFFLLTSNPDNVRKMLTLKSIGGVDIKEVIRLAPHLLLTPYQQVQETLGHIKNFGIPEESITKCFLILTLDSRIVRDRLKHVESREDLLAMKFHPGFLKAVYYNFKTNARLDYLNQMEKKCFPIGVLTGPLELFQRFTLDEIDRYGWAHCVHFLADIFNEKTEDVKKEISRHPHYLYIPIGDMKETIDILRREGFDLKDIYSSIHLVLYSGQFVLNRINKLRETEQIHGCPVQSMPKSLQLKLVLYQMEAEFRFTGDAVWVDRKKNFDFD